MANNRNKTPVCPFCYSAKIQPVGRKRKGFSVGKAVAGGILTGGVGTLAGFAGKEGEMEFYCSHCGKTFNQMALMKVAGKNDKERKKEAEAVKAKNKKIILITFAVVAIIGLIGYIGGAGKKEETAKIEEDRLDILRKCTVMEAADIYITGIGKKSDNVFNDAKKTCDNWYADWGKDEFYEIIKTDWEDRKDEQINDEPLTHYLEILGW